MRNNYKIKKDIVHIEIANKKNEQYEALVDVSELDRLISENLSWHLEWKETSNAYYVKATKYLGIIDGKPKYKTVRLHKFIMNTGEVVDYIDHINHNPLDNRLENLRITNKSENGKNRIKANTNNKTGYRNICERYNKLVVQLQIDGKNKTLGTFDLSELDAAIKFSEEMRDKYY